VRRISVLVVALVSACSRAEPTPVPATSAAPTAPSASASASTPALAKPTAPDVDLPALRAKYCAKGELPACKMLDEFEKAGPLGEVAPDAIFFGWGHEAGGGGDGQKSMVVVRLHDVDGKRSAKAGVYLPTDDKAKTTTDLIETLRGGGKATGDAKGFVLFLRTHAGPDPWRPLGGTVGTSSVYAGSGGFIAYLRRDASAKGTRVLVVGTAGGEKLDGPHHAELRVSEVWELHTD
jgi:hypothetical protein